MIAVVVDPDIFSMQEQPGICPDLYVYWRHFGSRFDSASRSLNSMSWMMLRNARHLVWPARSVHRFILPIAWRMTMWMEVQWIGWNRGGRGWALPREIGSTELGGDKGRSDVVSMLAMVEEKDGGAWQHDRWEMNQLMHSWISEVSWVEEERRRYHVTPRFSSSIHIR